MAPFFAVAAWFLPQALWAQYNGYKDWTQYERTLKDRYLLTDEASELAERVMDIQLENGSWPKNLYYPQLTAREVADLHEKCPDNTRGTVENKATLTEIHFLSNMFQATDLRKYRKAAENGIAYLLKSQYPSGGWPLAAADPQEKSRRITYAGSAMVNVLRFLGDVLSRKEPYSYLSEEVRAEAQASFQKGIECVLQTQLRQNGKLAGWSASYTPDGLRPVGEFHPDSLTINTVETSSIALLLMDIQHPDARIQAAVNGVVEWLNATVVKGLKRENYINKQGKRDFRLIPDQHAPGFWYRDYSLADGQPVFSEPDGTRKPSMDQLTYERRVQVNWMTNEPQKVLKKYEKWKLNR